MPNPKHVSVYPKGDEKEIWDECAGTFGINFSNFARKAINSYLGILKIFYPNIPTPDTGFVDEDLVNKVYELLVENKQLKQDIKELRAAMRNLTTDYWDKVWRAISTDRYKTAEQILIDAGIINSSMDYEQIQAAIHYLNDGLGEENRIAKQEGKEPPFDYKPGEGWKRKV